MKCYICHKVKGNLRHELIGGDFGWGPGPAYIYRCRWCRFKVEWLPSLLFVLGIGLVGTLMYLVERLQ